MPYIKIPKFKTGINPSLVSGFDMKNLTGTQKVMLAGSRIFGYNIGGNYRTGTKVITQALRERKLLDRYRIPIWDVSWIYPWITYEKEKERHKLMLERRKVRILMRGVKIGKKKGGEKVAVSNAFEKKSETKTG